MNIPKHVFAVLVLGFGLAACAETPKHIKQIEVSSLQSQAFCKNSKLKSYIETDYYHSFTCDDGSYFFLPRKD